MVAKACKEANSPFLAELSNFSVNHSQLGRHYFESEPESNFAGCFRKGGLYRYDAEASFLSQYHQASLHIPS